MAAGPQLPTVNLGVFSSDQFQSISWNAQSSRFCWFLRWCSLENVCSTVQEDVISDTILQPPRAVFHPDYLSQTADGSEKMN